MKPRVLLPVVVTLSTLFIVGPVSAQEPPPPIKPEFFKQRRQALMKRLGKGIVVMRGIGRQRSGLNGFSQSENFYYLTGVVQQNVALILFPETGKDMLLVEPYSRFTAQWEGDRIVPSEKHEERLQFDEIRVVRSLPRILAELIEDKDDKPVVWTSTGRTRRRGRARNASGDASGDASGRRSRIRFERPPTDEAVFAKNLGEMFEGLVIKNVDSHIRALRGVKGPEEIACITAATRIACAGIAEAIKSTRPGVYEFQIAAAARYVFHRMGAGADAYAAIVGAGINGCVLHYSANTKKTLDGELVVMDYAPTVHGYASDVTRTFPTNGKFTPEQRKLVQDVHDVQQILIAMVKPGVTLREISSRSSRELRKRGYRSMHGPSHHVGLNVHDVGGRTLQPGMLITVEPGAYLPKKKMGCRIEDVILVTEDGNINLSAHLPSTPDGIEKLMRHQGVQQVPVGVPAAAVEARAKKGKKNE